ncbi:MAG TPA: MYXO-CTERM sorting domain-containing protein [Kofleriaceae bacterium]
MKWLCLLGLLVVLPLRDAAACVRPADGIEPHVLDSAHANDTTPPAAPTVTHSVDRHEVDGGCGTTTDCDGKYGRIYVSVVASDDAAPVERLGYLVRVVGGDVPRDLRMPWFDNDARQQPQGELALGFDYDDDAFDFELEVRVVDLNGNISEPTIVRIADEQSSGGCSTAASPGWWVLAAIAFVLRRRRR